MKTVAKLVTDPRLKQKLRDTTGIGTEATRANIINGLIGRGYLVKKGRAVRASDAAFTLIDAVPRPSPTPAPRRCGAGARHDRGRPDGVGHLHREAVRVGRSSSCSSTAARRFSLAAAGAACPQCGAPMQQRTGKSGAFWSCLALPGLRRTLPIESPTGRRSAPRKRRAASKAS